MKHSKISLLLISLGLVSSVAYGEAFRLNDQSAAQLGNAYAGGAAIADDASTEWYNPAGMVRLKHTEVSTGVTDIDTHIKFSGRVGQAGAPIVQRTGVAEAGGQNYIPNFHLVTPIAKDAWFGFGINVPFGLETNYSRDSIMAEYATLTKLETIDVSPSLGIALDKNFSVGFGFDYQYLLARFDNVAFDVPTMFDHNKMTDEALGLHAGVMYQFTPDSRIGLMYRSSVNHHATGPGHIELPAGLPAQPITTVDMDLELPATTTLSYYQNITKRWSMMASMIYTQWSSIKEFQINNVGSPAGPVAVTVPVNFRNTESYAVGTSFDVTNKWKLRLGFAYEGSPTRNDSREARLPDSIRTEVAVGTHYQATDALGFDLGYERIFAHDTSIDKTTDLAGDNVLTRGNYNNSSDVYGLQVTWKFM